MVAIKDFGMPTCCMNCNMFRVLDGDIRPQCAITETYIDDSDEYLDKRADDCPLVETKAEEKLCQIEQAMGEVNLLDPFEAIREVRKILGME